MPNTNELILESILEIAEHAPEAMPKVLESISTAGGVDALGKAVDAAGSDAPQPE